MKGDPKLIETLNGLLAEELGAINQYMLHAEMCDNWGYERLHKKVEARAIEEMRHAEKLIARILFLEGHPRVDKLSQIKIGSDVPQQFAHDLDAEVAAVRSYNAAIQLASQLGDNATKTLLEAILNDEEAHIDWLEAQLDQIKQMGLQVYLAEQIHA
jgi:bacterioferritin